MELPLDNPGCSAERFVDGPSHQFVLEEDFGRLQVERFPFHHDLIGKVLGQVAVLGPDRCHGLASEAGAVSRQCRPGSGAVASPSYRQVVQSQIGCRDAGTCNRADPGVREGRTDEGDFQQARGPSIREVFASALSEADRSVDP